MKIKPASADRFATHPDAAARAILVYGPDSGLIRERMNSLARSVVPDLSDPFRIADIPDNELRQDPARLADEAAAISMLGGRRVVRVSGAGDSLAKLFQSFLQDMPGDALVLVEGGELGPRSSLRKLFEDADNAAALACYADDRAALEATIRRKLGEEGLEADPAALDYLLAHLGNDRGITLNELEKLVLYMGKAEKDSRTKRTVGLQDVRACVGDNIDSDISDVVDAAIGGDVAKLDQALARARQADTNAIAMLNAVSRHLQQLHLSLADIESGTPPDMVVKSMRPPVHFSRTGLVRRQLSLWSRRRVERALELVAEAEGQCKTTGLPEFSICGQTLLRLAQAARSSARG